MHEFSIVQAMIDQVDDEVRRSGHPGRVMRLDLVVGRLSGVSVDAMRMAFQVLAPGTLVEAAQMEIAEPRAECACADCAARMPIEELVVQCPRCGSSQITIEGGRDLLLQSIELED